MENNLQPGLDIHSYQRKKRKQQFDEIKKDDCVFISTDANRPQLKENIQTSQCSHQNERKQQFQIRIDDSEFLPVEKINLENNTRAKPRTRKQKFNVKIDTPSFPQDNEVHGVNSTRTMPIITNITVLQNHRVRLGLIIKII